MVQRRCRAEHWRKYVERRKKKTHRDNKISIRKFLNGAKF